MVQLGFDTRAVHGAPLKTDAHHAIKYPIYAGVAFSFETAEEMGDAFAFRKPAHTYSRVTNPTVEAFERKINSLENGRASIAVASGMAAISNTFLNLVTQGENIISTISLFGNTYSFFKNTLSNFGVEVRFVDIDDPDQIKRAIDHKTRAIFLETISNPGMTVPDMGKVVEIAHDRGVAVIADSTVTTPYLFKGKDIGVDIVVHSSTKLISGGATAIGGVIVDLGKCEWRAHPSLSAYHKFGEWAFLARLRREVYRDLGACMAPQAAYLHGLGLETLALRIEKVCTNTAVIASFLRENGMVKAVNYPGLPDSPYHELAKKQFGGRFGGVLSFELADQQSCFHFLNRLKIIRRASNLGDNTSLILHPASTIFREYTREERQVLGVTEGLIRLSVGIETVEDLIRDIDQALSR
ncbi:MAG: O-acetylhomoserine aminocarboxypropyltransferase/cysteine synthase [Deltaproteobacteria bacterium]|nr:O-acetylhomoserine aminocarboxypropyltransferase/cysteine synthase [Deltaproteobacteria bacterium]